MTNLNDRQRKQLMPMIMAKQGGYYCVQCQSTPEDLIIKGILPKLYIDHIDNNNDNNKENNLQFLCVSCNTKKNHPSKILDEAQTDPVFVASQRNTARARQYVIGRMLEPGIHSIERDELIDDMAEFLNNSQQANKNYLAKMTSKRHGLFNWQNGKNGLVYLVWKDDKSLNDAMASSG